MKIILTVLSAIFLILSFPNFNLYYLAWVAFLPLFFALDGLSPARSFGLAYIAGVLFFLGTIYWLVHVTLPGMIIVAAYLAFYIALFGLIFSLLSRLNSFILLFFVPSLWVSLEYARSHVFTGFGWNLLAHSQCPNLPVIQIADVTGAYGVSFLIVAFNYALFVAIKNFRKREYDISCLITVTLVLFICAGYGIYRLNNIFTGQRMRVALVQGNIPQERKWDELFRLEILQKYTSLTIAAAKEECDLIIWPETSVPGFLEDESNLLAAVSSLVRKIKTPLLVGTPRDKNGRYYNSAVLFLADGSIAGRYDKVHLVPFGEFLPLRNLFSFVENFAKNPIGDFHAGADYTVFKLPVEHRGSAGETRWRSFKNIRFSTLICFEDIFPEISRRFVLGGAHFLINITNDAWFGRTSAPYQHAQNSIFRAVENRVNVLRAANTGLSCFIDQKGMVTKRVDVGGKSIFVGGYLVNDITLTGTRTFYNRYGDVFVYVCLLVSVIGLGAAVKR